MWKKDVTPYKSNFCEIRKYQHQFEREKAQSLSRSSLKRYVQALEMFLKRFPEKKSPMDFSRQDILEYRAYRRKADISGRTVNYEINVVKMFWMWMLATGLAEFNPFNQMTKLQEAEVKRTALSMDAQEEILAVTQSPQEKLLVGLAFSTAFRTSTLTQLEKRFFDLEKRVVEVPAEIMKTRHSLRLPIRNSDIEIIKALPEGNIWQGWANNEDSLRYKFKRICRRAGYVVPGMHTARRTVATTMIRNGTPLNVVSKILGHSSIKTTVLYTLNTDEEDLRKAMSSLPIGD
jgi:integrase/recombinase XerC